MDDRSWLDRTPQDPVKGGGTGSIRLITQSSTDQCQDVRAKVCRWGAAF
jgi:hypothetical protein